MQLSNDLCEVPINAKTNILSLNAHNSGAGSTITSQGSWFKSQLGPFCVEFACSPHVWFSPGTPASSFLIFLL